MTSSEQAPIFAMAIITELSDRHWQFTLKFNLSGYLHVEIIGPDIDTIFKYDLGMSLGYNLVQFDHDIENI